MRVLKSNRNHRVARKMNDFSCMHNVDFRFDCRSIVSPFYRSKVSRFNNIVSVMNDNRIRVYMVCNRSRYDTVNDIRIGVNMHIRVISIWMSVDVVDCIVGLVFTPQLLVSVLFSSQVQGLNPVSKIDVGVI
jgi:hypothetical protein